MLTAAAGTLEVETLSVPGAAVMDGAVAPLFGLIILGMPVACLGWTVTHAKASTRPRFMSDNSLSADMRMLLRSLGGGVFCGSGEISTSYTGLVWIFDWVAELGMDCQCVHELVWPVAIGH